jgi:nucleotidyltransferase/DNA polymerase involved in DNA repair
VYVDAPRVILHVDLDAFFCAVEELRNPSLRGQPFAVAGKPDERGVVSSASYAARKFGVRNAMPTSQALRLCPKLIIVAGSHGIYGEYSRRVMTILRDYTDELQQISVDEAFLDVTPLNVDGRAIAEEIQRRIREEQCLPASIGVASNKLVAKIASGDAKPNGIKIVPPTTEAAYLAPMPVRELWGIGAVTAEHLQRIGIRTIGDLASSAPEHLRAVFGNHAASAVARAQGIDDSPVQADREIKSISEETTFVRDVASPDTLRNTLLALSDQVAARLRHNDLRARTVHLKLRWSDFSTITRQTTLAQSTQLENEIFGAVEKLWLGAWSRGQKVRLLGVGMSGFDDGAQMSLFEDQSRDKQLALSKTLDALREQYGRRVIQRARLSPYQTHRSIPPTQKAAGSTDADPPREPRNT